MKFRVFLFFLMMPLQMVQAQSLDLRLYDELYTNRNTGLDGAMNVVSFTVYPIAAAVPLAQMIYAFAMHDAKSFDNAIQTGTALFINTALTYSIKEIAHRERPYDAHPQYIPYERDGSPSFPSGHVSFAFATATTLSLEYKKWYVTVPAFAWAGVVGYSRVHLGQHYPGDVLAGAVVGAGSSFIAYKANQWFIKKWSQRVQQKLHFERP